MKVETPSIDVIQQTLKVGADIVTSVRREMGLGGLDKTRAGVEQRRQRMRELADQGYTSRQIAEIVGEPLSLQQTHGFTGLRFRGPAFLHSICAKLRHPASLEAHNHAGYATRRRWTRTRIGLVKR